MPKLYYILLILVFAIVLFALYHTWFRWIEHFDPLEKVALPETFSKKESMLLIQYGNMSLDLGKFSDQIRAFAKENHMDYFTSQDTNIWKTVYTFFEKFNYEYICIVPSKVYMYNFHKKPLTFETLLKQAGDSCMILCRNEMDPKQLNMDVIIFRRSEWTNYKLHQFFYKSEEHATLSTEIILDQVYTPYVHKTFDEFTDYLTMGIPYMLTNICVYNEHALISSTSNFLRYHDRENSKKESSTLIYPWDTIKHPRFTMIKSDDPIKIEIPASGDSKIPRLIFQTMETHLTMVNVRSCIEQVQTLNPTFKYYYFSSYDCRRFIQTYYSDILDAYDLLLPGAYKADLWRYCVLHHYGGFYMDSRMYPYLAFEAIVTKETEFMSCIDCTPNMLYQAILGVAPKSSFMRYAIDESVENIRKRRGRIGDLAVTGPRVMGRALNKVLKRNVNRDLTDIEDRRIVLLRWNTTKAPKYLMNADEIFACHKYTKLLTDREVDEETTQWLMLTGKEHYSASYRNQRIFKDKLFDS